MDMIGKDSLVIGKAARPESRAIGDVYTDLPIGFGGEQGPSAWRYPSTHAPLGQDELIVPVRGRGRHRKELTKKQLLELLATIPVGALANNRAQLR